MSTISELVIGSTILPRVNHPNQSFSDVDYLPMKSGCLQIDNRSSDCYLNTDMNDEKKA